MVSCASSAYETFPIAEAANCRNTPRQGFLGSLGSACRCEEGGEETLDLRMQSLNLSLTWCSQNYETVVHKMKCLLYQGVCECIKAKLKKKKKFTCTVADTEGYDSIFYYYYSFFLQFNIH